MVDREIYVVHSYFLFVNDRYKVENCGRFVFLLKLKDLRPHVTWAIRHIVLDKNNKKIFFHSYFVINLFL